MARYQILYWKDIPSLVEADEQDRPGPAREVARAIVDDLEARFAEFRDRGLGQGG